MIDPRLAWFAAGATVGAEIVAVLLLCGWPWHPRLRRYNLKPDSSKKRPRKFAELLRLDPGRVQRGNGSGGPTTPKPSIKPQPTGGTLIINGRRYPLASWSVPLHPGSNPPAPGRKPEPPCNPPPRNQ